MRQRDRMIRGPFFKHGDLYDCEAESGGLPVRLAFIGLWTMTDREGRFEWKPRELKADVLPYDDGVNFAAILDALARRGFVVPYDVDGARYGYIPGFLRQQRIPHGEAKSTLPPPPFPTDDGQLRDNRAPVDDDLHGDSPGTAPQLHTNCTTTGVQFRKEVKRSEGNRSEVKEQHSSGVPPAGTAPAGGEPLAASQAAAPAVPPEGGAGSPRPDTAAGGPAARQGDARPAQGILAATGGAAGQGQGAAEGQGHAVALRRRRAATKAAADGQLSPVGEHFIAQMRQILVDVEQGTAQALTREQVMERKVELVFAYWAAKMNHPGALLDDKRAKRIRDRLRENGGDCSELCYTVDGAAHDNFLMGREPGKPEVRDGIDTILRDRATVERLSLTRPKFRAGVTHATVVKYQAVFTEQQTGGD